MATNTSLMVLDSLWKRDSGGIHLTGSRAFRKEKKKSVFRWISKRTRKKKLRSRGDVFVVRTSKPVESLWKNGLFWSRYSFVTHSIDRKPRDWGLGRSAYSIKYFFYSALRASVALRATAFGHPSGDVPCASEDMACGYWFSKWRTTKSIWVR